MKIYVTFGQGHVHNVNGKTFDKDCVAMLKAENYGEGRRKAFECFNNKFCTTYDESDITPGFMCFFPRGIIEV